MRELSLIIKQKWFDEIVAGTKKVETRELRANIAHRYIEYVDDATGKSLVQTSTTSKDFQAQNGSLNKTEQSRKLGALVAALAKEKNIEQVVFDRGGYTYHGRVKAFADAAREAGMVF